jgi:cell division protein FtsQ
MVAIVLLFSVGAVLYYSPVLAIKTLKVDGMSYLKEDQLTSLVQIPTGATFFRVDSKAIVERLQAEPWIQDVGVKRVFPSTLVVQIKERQPIAIVEVSSFQESTGKGLWLVSDDDHWICEMSTLTPKQLVQLLGSIPKISINNQGAAVQAGPISKDDVANAGVLNVLSIVGQLTPAFLGQIQSFTANDAISTSFTMKDGLEVSFGVAEDVPAKQKVIEAFRKEYGEALEYINVRVADKATIKTKGDAQGSSTSTSNSTSTSTSASGNASGNAG